MTRNDLNISCKLLFCLCGMFLCLLATETSAQPYWRVEAVYPVRANGEISSVRLTWRFEVQEIFGDDSGTGWAVRVADEEGISGLVAEFFFYPAEGRIESARYWKFHRREWREWPVALLGQDGVYLQDPSFIPLDFISRSVAGSLPQGEKSAVPRRFLRTVDERTRLATLFQLRAVTTAEACCPVIEDGRSTEHRVNLAVLVHGPQYQPQSREMLWGEDLPWWLEYHTPAFSARLIEWAAGVCDE